MSHLKNKGAAKNLVKVLFWFLLIPSQIISQEIKQELWNDIVETTAGNGYQKKVINLALQLNYVHFQPAQREKPLRVLVMLTQKDKNDWYFKTIVDKFNPEISVLDYKLDNKINENPLADETAFQKARIEQYLKKGNLFNTWPPIYTETAEIKKELEQKNYDQKYLLLTGSQSKALIYSSLIKEFNRIIIVSPDNDLGAMKNEPWQNKQVLWIGAFHEKGKLENLQVRFGGKVLTYERSLTGQSLLMRNQKVLGDILTWLNNE
jgi:hypothetical protein